MKNNDVRAAFAALSTIAFLATGGCAASGVNATPAITADSAAASAASPKLTYKVFTAGTTPGFPASAFAADIAPGSDGTMWFTDGGAAPAIGRISTAGTIREFRKGLLPYAKPFRIALGADGNMWFSDAGNLAIGRVTPSGKLSEFSAPNPNQIGARGLAFAKDGTPWFITCGGNAVLGSVSAQGKMSLERIPTDLSPDGTLAADARGSLWFLAVDQNSAGVVVERVASGRLLRLPMHLDHGAEPCCPNEAPRRLTIGPDGHPWFTTQYFVSNTGANYIGTVRSGKVVLFKIKGYNTTGIAYPSGIASGKTLWITGGNPFGLSGGLWNVGASGRQTAYKLTYNPFGLTVDAEGNPWFTATFNSTPSQIVEAIVK